MLAGDRSRDAISPASIVAGHVISRILFLYNTGHKWLDIDESTLTKKKEEQTSKVSSHVPVHTHLQMNQQLSTWLLI